MIVRDASACRIRQAGQSDCGESCGNGAPQSGQANEGEFSFMAVCSPFLKNNASELLLEIFSLREHRE
jgi:hypothetical protein